MKETELEHKAAALLRPAVEQAGFRLVCVAMKTESTGPVLRVMAENRETRNLGVDDCAKLSRGISALLDVEDIMKGAYRLEISSPGIDRPLVDLQDFADYRGFEVKIEIEPPLQGQKRFRGRLAGTEDNAVLLETDQGRVALPFGSVHKAKLVLTDELIKATGTKGSTA